MTTALLARKTIDFEQGALMSPSEVKKLMRWIEVQTSWERWQYAQEIARLESEGLRGERRI